MSSRTPWSSPAFARHGKRALLPHHSNRFISLVVGLALAASALNLPAAASANTPEGELAAAPAVASNEGAPHVSEFDLRSVAGSAIERRADIPNGLLEQMGEDSPFATPRATYDAPALNISTASNLVFRFEGDFNAAAIAADFVINPATPGVFAAVNDNTMIFTPSQPLEPGTSYEVSLADDTAGIPVGIDSLLPTLSGQTRFYFQTREAASIVAVSPIAGTRDITPAKLTIEFSQPMDVVAVNKAFALHDPTVGGMRAGEITWNETSTVLTFVPDKVFERGRTLTMELRDGSVDADGNGLTGEWNFSTPAISAPVALPAPAQPGGGAAPAPALRPAPAAVAPSTSLAGHALNQINAARVAYGRAPLRLDASLNAAASAHAYDQLRNGYYSHVSLFGADLGARLAAVGVFPGNKSENQCHYYSGNGATVMNWCHAQFMSEPYPGHPNHIANILSPNFTRVGVGVASSGGHTIITWDFSN